MKKLSTGEKVKKLGEKHALTKQALSAKAGISTGTLYRVENNIGKVNLTTLKALAGVFGVSVEELVG